MLCCLESDYCCNRQVLGCCRKNSSSSAHADSLAVQLSGPLSLFGCEQDRCVAKGQVKDRLFVPDGIGLGLLMGSLKFSLLAVPTVP